MLYLPDCQAWVRNMESLKRNKEERHKDFEVGMYIILAKLCWKDKTNKKWRYIDKVWYIRSYFVLCRLISWHVLIITRHIRSYLEPLWSGYTKDKEREEDLDKSVQTTFKTDEIFILRLHWTRVTRFRPKMGQIGPN